MKNQSRAKDILRRIDLRVAELAQRAADAGQKFPTSDRALSLAAVGSTDTLRSIRRNLERNATATISLPVIEMFARYLRVHLEWLLNGTGVKELEDQHIESSQIAIDDQDPSSEFIGTVPLVGYVGAGAEAHFYAVAQGELDRVPAPTNATKTTVAVEIRGRSVGEMFDRWLVYYDDVRSPITADLIGKLCVVGLPDNRILVKKIRRSKQQGRFDLLSENEPPIEGAAIEWAAKVTQMAPQ